MYPCTVSYLQVDWEVLLSIDDASSQSWDINTTVTLSHDESLMMSEISVDLKELLNGIVVFQRSLVIISGGITISRVRETNSSWGFNVNNGGKLKYGK